MPHSRHMACLHRAQLDHPKIFLSGKKIGCQTLGDLPRIGAGCTQAVLCNKYTWACQLNFPHTQSIMGWAHAYRDILHSSHISYKVAPTKQAKASVWKLWPKTSKTPQRS